MLGIERLALSLSRFDWFGTAKETPNPPGPTLEKSFEIFQLRHGLEDIPYCEICQGQSKYHDLSKAS